MSEYTGEYLKHGGEGTGEAVYYSFVPRPLMDGNFYTIDEELASLLAQAHGALGTLDGMISYMRDKESLEEIMLTKECIYSMQIDNPTFSFATFLETRGVGKPDRNVQKIMNAYRNSFGTELHVNYLTDIYTIVASGLESEVVLGFRDVPFFMHNLLTNAKVYNPTYPGRIRPALIDMVNYLTESTADVLIKAALTHYQFEMIHPFDAHNGIVGRILISKVLRDSGLSMVSSLCISEGFYHANNDYFDILESTQTSGGYLRWIKFFVQCVLDTAHRSIEQITQYHQVVQHDVDRLKSNRQTTKSTLAIFDYYKHYLMSTSKLLVENLHLTYPTATKSVKMLSEMGILKQNSAGSRNRLFSYHELTSLFVDSI